MWAEAWKWCGEERQVVKEARFSSARSSRITSRRKANDSRQIHQPIHLHHAQVPDETLRGLQNLVVDDPARIGDAIKQDRGGVDVQDLSLPQAPVPSITKVLGRVPKVAADQALPQPLVVAFTALGRDFKPLEVLFQLRTDVDSSAERLEVEPVVPCPLERFPAYPRVDERVVDVEQGQVVTLFRRELSPFQEPFNAFLRSALVGDQERRGNRCHGCYGEYLFTALKLVRFE
ncbi:hypothetical protein IE53DRAFT_32599 [Violaceomyces palustris]|uniref:Uncharacterized protein n=1 Tax=Violaceomyces palustris TaxID=1673888 RepID=A0ACD0P7R8_9BASI|nr:hypothetical protein IE53DRAFT_32599 [Violaceomyces palustris]